LRNVLRFQFSKGPEVRFLSHLDVVRTMERALRRAHLPIAYSEGFSPRPIMSYGYALPVGILSEAEYGDFVFARKIDPDEFVVRYNQHLPQGFRVLRAERVADRTPALMRAINAASWSVLLRGQGTEEISKRLEWLQGVDSFVVKRETNKGSREIDVRPLLYAVVGVQTVDTGTVIQCYSGLGNEANLRMNELGELLGFDHLSAVITRTGQFKKVGDHYYSPLGNRG
jgi:radical SAM-linked protein